ncbi:MAG: sugar phosphate nucleotidyltransferase [Candidatus Hodarchaeota archaeon]
MKCIIPAAGKGTRLRPHTHTKPKALISLGNKPIIAHILDNVVEANIRDVIFIVGYGKDLLINYVESKYDNICNIKFIEQKERKGLGHAIYSAASFLDGKPVLIALGDSLYENSFSQMLKEYAQFPNWVGAITVKSVSNPQAYGIVTTHDNSNTVKNLEEKPQTPQSSLAITGVYIIRDSLKLKDALTDLVISGEVGAGGEFQLTDALQIMIDKGMDLGAIDSGRWFDCGRKEALLAAHKYILDENKASRIESKLNNSITRHPVAIQAGCEISNSIIGPYVSIDRETRVDQSIITSTIIGRCSYIKETSIRDSLVGDRVELIGQRHDLNIGDHSKVKFF